MKKTELKELIREEIQNVLSEGKLNMRKVLRILKDANYPHSISRGNRLFPTEILAGTKRIDDIDWGAVKITPSGALYGPDNWGMDIEKEEDILQALDQFEIDQENYYKKHYPEQYKDKTGEEI